MRLAYFLEALKATIVMDEAFQALKGWLMGIEAQEQASAKWKLIAIKDLLSQEQNHAAALSKLHLKLGSLKALMRPLYRLPFGHDI